MSELVTKHKLLRLFQKENRQREINPSNLLDLAGIEIGFNDLQYLLNEFVHEGLINFTRLSGQPTLSFLMTPKGVAHKGYLVGKIEPTEMPNFRLRFLREAYNHCNGVASSTTYSNIYKIGESMMLEDITAYNIAKSLNEIGDINLRTMDGAFNLTSQGLEKVENPEVKPIEYYLQWILHEVKMNNLGMEIISEQLSKELEKGEDKFKTFQDVKTFIKNKLAEKLADKSLDTFNKFIDNL